MKYSNNNSSKFQIAIRLMSSHLLYFNYCQFFLLCFLLVLFCLLKLREKNYACVVKWKIVVRVERITKGNWKNFFYHIENFLLFLWNFFGTWCCGHASGMGMVWECLDIIFRLALFECLFGDLNFNFIVYWVMIFVQIVTVGNDLNAFCVHWCISGLVC